MKTILSFNCLQAEKDASKDLERKARLEYPMDLFIKEVKRINSCGAMITFTLSSSTKPEVASFSVSGELYIEGSDDEVSTALSSTGKEPPPIWKSIYNEGVSIITLLAKVIDVPFPAPNIGVGTKLTAEA